MKKSQSEKQVKDTIWHTFNKALSINSIWPDKEEYLDVVYWMRQVIGLIMGIVCGCLPITGIVAMILFAVIEAVTVQIYTTNYQCLDVDELGGITEVLKEGFMTAFASFLVTWIIFYSAMHN